MTILESVILGAIEGLTEFLPISSTGHLILAGDIMSIPETEFFKSFGIIIQLGAIAAVLVLYGSEFFKKDVLKKIIAGSIPTAIIGAGLYKIIKNDLLGSENVVLWSLLIGGLILIIFEFFYRGPDVEKEDVSKITYKQALFIGVFQTLSVIPGVSRSAATIIGGLSLGIPRATIVKFSFLLAVPVILGASLLDMYETPAIFAGENVILLIIGFITAFIVGLFAIKFLIKFAQTRNFMPFGIYRVLLSLLFFFVIF